MNETIAAGEVLQTNYQMGLVFLSYCISVLGSFVALTAAQRIRAREGIQWMNVLAAGAALGGVGVWSMHFTGMLALHLGMASGYALLETVVSLVAAVAATSMALAYVAHDPNNNQRLLTAGALLGLGVAVMHYLGMFGMRFPGYIIWDWGVVALSVVIAVAAASAALWLAFRTSSLAMRGIAAAVMGVAVCSMHYTGMYAADFVCTSPLTRFAAPQGFLVMNALDLPLITAIAAVGMGVLIGFDQMLQRTLRMAPR